MKHFSWDWIKSMAKIDFRARALVDLSKKTFEVDRCSGKHKIYDWLDICFAEGEYYTAVRDLEISFLARNLKPL
jgi:hypothetical protein